MTEILKRRIKGITGNGTSTVKIFPSEGLRLHALSAQITFPANASYDTVAEQAAAITEIRVKTGTAVRRRLNGTELRDYLLLNGTAHDFDAVSTYVLQLHIPFAEDWFHASVADSLAWNPEIVGPISIEIDATPVITVDAREFVSDDVKTALSSGIITWERITPVGGSATSFFVEKEIEARGDLIQASIYGTGGTVTEAIVYAGKKEEVLFEARSAENLDDIARIGMTPTASGRTGNMFDIVPVRGDALSHAWALKDRKIKMKLISAGFSLSTPIILARLEPR